MISADVPQPSDPPGIALPLQGSVGAGTCSDKSARTALPWHRFVGGVGSALAGMPWPPTVT